MKKISFLFAFLIGLSVAFAFAPKAEEPKLKVELTVGEWQAVMQVIDQSSAPHNTVIAVQGALGQQLQKELQAISEAAQKKAAADSAQKK